MHTCLPHSLPKISYNRQQGDQIRLHSLLYCTIKAFFVPMGLRNSYPFGFTNEREEVTNAGSTKMTEDYMSQHLSLSGAFCEN